MCPKQGDFCNNINKWTDPKDDYGMNGSRHTLNFKLVNIGEDNFEIQDL